MVTVITLIHCLEKSIGVQDEDQTARPVASALDDLLGNSFKVLDDGFVRAIDYFLT